MPNQVTLFVDTNFQGDSLVITEAIPDLTKLNFNNKVNSAIVEGGTWTFCLDVNYQGVHADLAPGHYGDLRLQALNDPLSSLQPTPSSSASSSSASVQYPNEQQPVVFVQPPRLAY
jgi:hypothetical protein